jgi:hypothetical protein
MLSYVMYLFPYFHYVDVTSTVRFDTELSEHTFLVVFSSTRLSYYLFRFGGKYNLVWEDGRQCV